jgi:hypothetical protein
MVKSNNVKKIILIIISVITLIAISGFIFVAGVRWVMGDTSERRALWRDRSRDLISDTDPGLSPEQIIAIAQKHGFAKEWIHRRDSELYASTPGEIGATNWIIRFGFSGDKLIYVKVRTLDNIDFEHPKDAPEDIFYSLNDVNE